MKAEISGNTKYQWANHLAGLLVTVLPLAAQDDSIWQKDIAAFDTHLGKLTADARTPSEEEFDERVDKHGWEESGLETITDGYGGVVDFRPAEDTVQFRVNETLKGKQVRWELVLGDEPYFADQVMLQPRWGTWVDVDPETVEKKDVPYLNAIAFNGDQSKLPPTPLKKGERIVVEGRIGDASQNAPKVDAFFGATAIHYLDGVPHPIFWIGLESVVITRNTPKKAEEEVSKQDELMAVWVAPGIVIVCFGLGLWLVLSFVRRKRAE